MLCSQVEFCVIEMHTHSSYSVLPLYYKQPRPAILWVPVVRANINLPIFGSFVQDEGLDSKVFIVHSMALKGLCFIEELLEKGDWVQYANGFRLRVKCWLR